MPSNVHIVVVLIVELGQYEVLCQNLGLFNIDHCDLIYYVLLLGFRRLVADTVHFLFMVLNVHHKTSSRILDVRVKLYVDTMMFVSKLCVIVFGINHAELSRLDISKDAIVFPIVADTVFIEELKVFLDLVIVD